MTKPYTAKVSAELMALEDMPDSEIDYSDIPRQKESDWIGAERGRFYRPVKEKVTVRIDADILLWLKSGGKGYQTRMNDLLRKMMLGHQQRTG